MRHSNGQPAGGMTFKHVPLGAGGQLIKLHIANDGTKVVCADIHGAYIFKPGTDTKMRAMFTNSGLPAGVRTLDGTWTGYPGGTYNDHSGCWDAVLCPSDSTHVLMIVDGQLCQSTDTGNTFTALTNFARSKFSSNGHDMKAWEGHNIAYDPNNNQVILFGTNGNGVFYTTNGGSTVSSLSVTAGNTSPGGYPSPHWVACDPTSTQSSGIRQTWYYTRYGFGIYRSTTGPGGAYSLIASSPTNVSSFFVDTFGTVWCTVYGETGTVHKWTSGGGWVAVSVAPSLGGSGYGFGKIAVDPASANRQVFVSGLGDYFSTPDGGTTWQRWTGSNSNTAPEQITRDQGIKPFNIPGSVNQWTSVANMIQFDPGTAGRLWVSSWIDLVYADLPASAYGSSSPLNWIGMGAGIEEAVVHMVCPVPGGKCFAGCWDLGSYRVDDLTRNVNPQVTAYNSTDTYGAGLIHPLLVQPCSSIGYAADNHNWMAFMEWGGWQSSTRVVCHVGYSTDGGQTLQLFPTTPPNCPLSSGVGGGSLAVGKAGNVIIIWDCNQAPVYTKDGGNTWANLPSPFLVDGSGNYGFDYHGTVGDGYFLNKHIITYDAAGGYFYLFNYGNSNSTNPLGVWRSTNGDSWTQMTSSTPSLVNWVSAAHLKAVPGQAGHLFFTPGNGGSTGTGGFTGDLCRSTDGGATWSRGLTTNSGQTIQNCSDIGFAKTATGLSYPAIGYWASVNGTFGFYVSWDNLVTSKLMSTAPDNSTDYPMYVAGDQDVVGRFWLGMSGNGLIVGDYSFAETVS